MVRNITIYQKALYYRKKGYSYGMISKKLNLAKSTLSNWLKEIPYVPNLKVKNRIKLAILKSAKINHQKRLDSIKITKKLAIQEIGYLTRKDLWMIGIGLYLGEGSRLYESVRIINSDPDIIKLAIKWLKNICGLNDKNFLPYIHIYPDIKESEALAYWSKITGISKKQFGKTQWDMRSNKTKKKKRKLPFGTLHLQTRSLGQKNLGVILHRRIMGWIESVNNQFLIAGVV